MKISTRKNGVINYNPSHIRRKNVVKFGPQTVSVFGVGFWLAVCLKGAKIEKSLFSGIT